jgi:hypothetical protein
MIENLTVQLKLVYRLMRDRRVNILLKLIPLFALIYFVFPDPIPLPLEVDDWGVLVVCFYLFVQLSPPEIVAEHLAAIRQGVPGKWKDPANTGEVIDVGFKELDPKSDPEKQPDAGDKQG